MKHIEGIWTTLEGSFKIDAIISLLMQNYAVDEAFMNSFFDESYKCTDENLVLDKLTKIVDTGYKNLKINEIFEKRFNLPLISKPNTNDDFMIWFDSFIDNILNNKTYLGNLGSPVQKTSDLEKCISDYLDFRKADIRKRKIDNI